MILSREDASQFFRLMWGLQLYVNRQMHILPDIADLDAYARLDRKDKVKVRDTLWKNPALIDDYVQANPESLSPDDLDIVHKWNGFVADTFYILRYLKHYAVFLGRSKVYAVLGLFDDLDAVFGHRPLPIMVEAVLLPFKGKIIYDGSCRVQNIVFGAGIRSSFEETYRTAKQNGRVIIGLAPETMIDRPLDRRPKLNEDCESAMDQIVQASERLRGGTVVQSSAFALLRASAELVQVAVQSPDDLDAMGRSGHRVGLALSRMQKALERAEK